MSVRTSFTRRHLIGALGAAGVAGARGVAFAARAGADGVDKDDEPWNPAPPSTGISPRDLANPIVQTLSGVDFMPEDNIGLTWAYGGSGGVFVTAGASTFSGGLRLPVGAVITGAQMLIDPHGVARQLFLQRYRAIPTGAESVAYAFSTAGTAPEAVPLAVTHTIGAGWAYRFEIVLSVGGPTLYGAAVTYTIPPDPAYPAPPPTPVGLFVPFTGANPRVYDTRAGAGKLAANQERVIPLGVPGTAQAAVFNLTVTETQTAGFVACFGADIAWPGNSSINWYEAGANTANLVTCAVDASGQIKIRGGNDATHVVIDLVGTFA
jgi:hypothetical protein